MKTGRYHVGVGLLVMPGFMLYGFLQPDRRPRVRAPAHLDDDLSDARARERSAA